MLTPAVRCRKTRNHRAAAAGGGRGGRARVDTVRTDSYPNLRVVPVHSRRHVLLYVSAAVWVGDERDFFQPTRRFGWVSFLSDIHPNAGWPIPKPRPNCIHPQ